MKNSLARSLLAQPPRNLPPRLSILTGSFSSLLFLRPLRFLGGRWQLRWARTLSSSHLCVLVENSKHFLTISW